MTSLASALRFSTVVRVSRLRLTRQVLYSLIVAVQEIKSSNKIKGKVNPRLSALLRKGDMPRSMTSAEARNGCRQRYGHGLF